MTDDVFDPHVRIPEIARKHHRRTDVITLDDLVQAMWLEWVEGAAYRETASPQKLYGWMTRVAKTTAQRERVDYMYFTGEYCYTPGTVRNLLETVVWCAAEDCRDIEARADIREQVKQLPHKQKLALFKRYATGTRLSNAENSYVSRAVETITLRLNENITMIKNKVE